MSALTVDLPASCPLSGDTDRLHAGKAREIRSMPSCAAVCVPAAPPDRSGLVRQGTLVDLVQMGDEILTRMF
ncbi:hypothetical protein BL253_01505 [Pseudofrankia asymbiotica]|uniref:Uncharacterized protein n=1 Tax=Pseudofrankia asymbiotica TaxID=1834516 RepID=A0A1V2IK46_9ACTN|nr:hypothetical protein BL253_01505 [Pseudofrankia asymbiotica]